MLRRAVGPVISVGVGVVGQQAGFAPGVVFAADDVAAIQSPGGSVDIGVAQLELLRHARIVAPVFAAKVGALARVHALDVAVIAVGGGPVAHAVFLVEGQRVVMVGQHQRFFRLAVAQGHARHVAIVLVVALVIRHRVQFFVPGRINGGQWNLDTEE